jgi:hypothetical protein
LESRTPLGLAALEFGDHAMKKDEPKRLPSPPAEVLDETKMEFARVLGRILAQLWHDEQVGRSEVTEGPETKSRKSI